MSKVVHVKDEEKSVVNNKGGGDELDDGTILRNGAREMAHPPVAPTDSTPRPAENASNDNPEDEPQTSSKKTLTTHEVEEVTRRFLAKNSKMPTAFMVWASVVRPIITKENPQIKPFGELNRLLGQEWKKNVSQEEEDRYKREILVECQRYQQSHPEKTIEASNAKKSGASRRRGSKNNKKPSSSSRAATSKTTEKEEASLSAVVDESAFLSVKDLHPLDVVFSSSLQHDAGKKSFRSFLGQLHAQNDPILKSQSTDAVSKHCLETYGGRFLEPVGKSHPKMLCPMTTEKCLPLIRDRVKAWMKSKGIPIMTPLRVVTPVNEVQEEAPTIPKPAPPLVNGNKAAPDVSVLAASTSTSTQEEQHLRLPEAAVGTKKQEEEDADPPHIAPFVLRKVNAPKAKNKTNKKVPARRSAGSVLESSSSSTKKKEEETHTKQTKKKRSLLSSMPFYVPSDKNKKKSKRIKPNGTTRATNSDKLVDVIDLTED